MTLKAHYYNIKQSIKNLIKWFPIIWKDRDWDYTYLLEIMKFKIDNQAKYLKKNNLYEGVQRDVEIMNLISKLIQKEINQDYEYEFSYEQFSECIQKYPLQYKRLIKQEPDLIGYDGTIVIIIMIANQQRCKRLLFKLIERNVNKWWD